MYQNMLIISKETFVLLCLKRQKKDYYNNLDLGSITDNKKFWNNKNPLFSDKFKIKSKITLVENKKIIANEENVCRVFSSFCLNIVPNLNIPTTIVTSDNLGIVDPIIRSIEKYKDLAVLETLRQKWAHLILIPTFNFLLIT